MYSNDKGSGPRPVPGKCFNFPACQLGTECSSSSHRLHYQRLTAVSWLPCRYVCMYGDQSPWIPSAQVLTALNQYSITAFCAHLKDGQTGAFGFGPVRSDCRAEWPASAFDGNKHMYLQIGNWIMFTTHTHTHTQSLEFSRFPPVFSFPPISLPLFALPI